MKGEYLKSNQFFLNRNEIVTMNAKPITIKLSSKVFFMKNVTTEIPKKNNSEIARLNLKLKKARMSLPKF